MMFVLGFLTGLGTAGTLALIAWTIVSGAEAYREEEMDLVAVLSDLHAREVGR